MTKRYSKHKICLPTDLNEKLSRKMKQLGYGSREFNGFVVVLLKLGLKNYEKGGIKG